MKIKIVPYAKSLIIGGGQGQKVETKSDWIEYFLFSTYRYFMYLVKKLKK